MEGPTLSEPNDQAVADNIEAELVKPNGVALEESGNTSLSDATAEVANNNKNTTEQANIKLGEFDITPAEGEEVKIVVQQYVDVKIDTVKANSVDTGKADSIVLDITPMAQIVATTAADTTNADNIKVKNDKTAPTIDENAVVLETKELKINKPVDISIQLPTGVFNDGPAYIKHIKNGRTYVYTGNVSAGQLTFISEHGFSPFEIVAVNPTTAKIGSVGYVTLQDAVDAVQNGETIVLQKDNAENVTVSRTVNFTLAPNGKTFTGSINAGSYTTRKDGETGDTYTFTYSRPSASVTYYDVTVAETANGTVTADTKSVRKNAQVTVTVKADAGYELDTLTVTDKSGKEVTLKAADGKYTFTMPASDVTVKATFKQIVKVDFVDVNEGDFFYDAVAWAVENGVTNGTSATTFSPKAECTRAEVVTFLWRAAGKPAAKNPVNPFTDLVEGSFYYDAVLWAVENGITDGTSATTFAPEMTVTRSQTVTFLHRYAGAPASEAANSFSDVEADSFYEDAVQWAAENAVTDGTSATTFSPNLTCTRGQTVTFLYRAVK